MSELIQTLWFEDTGFLHEQMLDTPVGRFSIRQMCLFLVFGLLAWITSLAFDDLVLKIVVAGATFFTGAALFTRKIKTISPEAHLLWCFKKFLQTLKQKKTPQTKNKQSIKPASKNSLLSTTISIPTKITNILKDHSRKTLNNKNFKVNINNNTHSNNTTTNQKRLLLHLPHTKPPQPFPNNHPTQRRYRSHPTNNSKHNLQKKRKEKRLIKMQKLNLRSKLKQQSQQPTYTYEVFPVNYVMLPKQKRQETLSHFQRLLNSLPCQTTLSATKTQKTIQITENELTTTYYRFFLKSLEPVDWLIEQCNFKQQPLTELPKTKTTKTFPKHLILENDKLQKTFTLYQLPGKLLPGFISELYGLCEKVQININPLPPETATTQMSKYLRLQKSILLADQTKGRLPKEETKLKHDMAQTTYQGLITGSTRLFELKVNLTLEADNLEDLKLKTKKLKDTLQSRFIRLDCPLYFQQELTNGTTGKKLVVDTTTLSSFFPFVSADLIESPGGVFLGINRLTGAPIVFDPHMRMNQNAIIMGKSGAGKSFTSKILLTRLLQKHPNLAYYIVDPENEYGNVGKLLGADVLDVTTEKNWG